MKGKDSSAYWLLLSAGALLWSVSASLDPFLNPWDERFHALVAKSMSENPFMPVLYDQIYPGTDPLNWSKAHIWLHKQPLFLWQMAISYKIFGFTVFATRIPSVLMLILMLHAVYRSASYLLNKRAAYIAAFLLVTCQYLHSLVSGQQGMDHNDIAFMSYVSLSIWAWLEYTKSNSRSWAIASGVFAGAAIMCKWLAGLAVFLPWGVWILGQHDKIRTAKDVAIALGITLLIFVPWMLYTLVQFPEVAQFELDYHHRHFNEVVEGHEGIWSFHFENFSILYGTIITWLVIPGMILLIIRSKKKLIAAGIAGLAVFIYIFFTIAATKLPGYTLPAAIVVFMASAAFLDAIFDKINGQASKLFSVLLLLITGWLSLDTATLLSKHNPKQNEFTRKQNSNIAAISKLGKDLPDQALLFNAPGRSYVDIMFYTGITAFGFIPDSSQIAAFKTYNRPMFVLNPPDEIKPIMKAEGFELISSDLVLNE